MISELAALNRTMMLSIDMIPVPTDEAVREMQNRLSQIRRRPQGKSLFLRSSPSVPN